MKPSHTCEFCGRQFETRQVTKVVRGKMRVFCSESCFIYWRYDCPKFDLYTVYDQYTLSFSMLLEDDPHRQT